MTSGRLAAIMALALLLTAAAPPPSDEVSADANMVVRRIHFDRGPIFSKEDRERLSWLPLGLVDVFHVDTRYYVIRRELVFAAGDRIGDEDLSESARRLRSTGFFGDASLEVVPVVADTVDVIVHTREIWTTAVNVTYEKFESELLWSAQLRERNFLGTARSFSVSRREDADRITWSFGLGDRQMFGGRWRGNLNFADSDDGSSSAWSIARPFFRVTSEWSLEAAYFNGGSRPRYYINGDQYIRPQGSFNSARVFLNHRARITGGAVWRVGGGVQISDQRFNTEAGLSVLDAEGDTETEVDLGAGVDENRDLRIPFVHVSRASRRFTEQRYLFSMGRIEDLPVGLETSLELGWATRAAGGSQSGLWFDARQRWIADRNTTLLVVGGGSRGLLGSDKVTDLRASGFASLYQSLHERMRLVVGVLGATADAIDRDQVFTLGLESGLRAARFREFAGDRLVRANVELRWIYTPGILDLATPGFALFGDFGHAWFEAEDDLRISSVRGAVGFGFRFGFNRGSEEAPIRIDLAWPVLYDNGRDGAVLSIGTGQVF